MKAMEAKRYKILEGSKSGHCCFDFTVIDTEVIMHGDPMTICECFNKEDAELVCTALNNLIMGHN